MHARRTPSRFKLASTVLGLATALAASGCEENVNYAYFLVNVTVSPTAPQEFQDRIAVCGVNVIDGNGTLIDQDSMPCAKCTVTSHKIGLIDWSTNRKSGQVRFVVTVNDLANDPDKQLGTGMSDLLTISPNGQAKGTVEVKEAANWLEIGANGGICPVK
jgi:hypothetical protein